MASGKIKVYFKRPNEKSKYIEIENTLAKFQELVEGYIEVIAFGEYLIVLNEEGKLRRLEPNICLGFDTVVGNIVIVKSKNEDFTGIKQSDFNYLHNILG